MRSDGRTLGGMSSGAWTGSVSPEPSTKCAIPSDAKLREDGRAPVEPRAGKDFAAVLGNKNQVREKSKASVSARPKALRVVHEPSILRSWFASTAIGSTQRVRKTRRCERRSIGCVNCTTLRLSIEPEAYRRQRVRVSAYGPMRELAAVREVRPEYASIHTHLLQDAITRLDRAYRAFFRRVKAGETPGFPRFKGKGRYRTFTFKDAAHRNGVRLVAGGERVELTGIGRVKVKRHRPIVGTVKQASVSLGGDGHGYVAFTCGGVPVESLAPTGRSVGIDVGITTLAALSDGTSVDNQRPYPRAQAALAVSQRRVSRRKRRGSRRRKAVALLAKQHDRVRRVRLDFHHKTAIDLVRRFDRIRLEDLNVKGLAQMRLAKQVHDAAWAQ